MSEFNKELAALAAWKEQPFTQRLMRKIEGELEYHRMCLETQETTDPDIIRLQEAIRVRKQIIDQPEWWLADITTNEEVGCIPVDNP